MRILIDGMGGDNAPEEIVAGVIDAAKEIDEELLIIGKKEEIPACLDKQGGNGKNIEVIDASMTITNDEAPVKAVRTKKILPSLKD